MSVMTQWGYAIDADRLPDIITPIEFDLYTVGKYLGDGRVTPGIAAASSAIRNYCGWHISPSEDCTFSEHILYGNGRIKLVGCDLLIQLPATFVSGVSSVTIGAEAFTDFAIEQNGLLHVFDVPGRCLNRKTKITVVYTAGYDDDKIPGIKELIADQVSHALTSSNGVQSETAGGVSITYSANWQNEARANHVTDGSKEALQAYKVQGVF